MNKNAKILIYLFSVLIILVSVLFFVSYKRLNPGLVLKDIINQIESSKHGIKISGKFNNSNSFFELVTEIEDVAVTKEGVILFESKKIEINFPWWALLFKEVDAMIDLQDSTLFLNKNLPNNKDTSFDLQLKLPSPLYKLKTNIRLKNFKIVYDNSKNKMFYVEKLLVRNIQKNSSFPFEIISPFYLNDEQNSKLNLKIFGEVGLDEKFFKINYRGDLSLVTTGDEYGYEEIVFDGRLNSNSRLNSMNSELDFFINKEKIGIGVLNFKKDLKKINLEFSQFPISYLNVFKKYIENPYLPELVSTGRGSLEIKSNQRDESFNLTGLVEFDGAFLMKSEISSIPGKWRFKIKNSLLENSFISPRADVSFFRRSFINSNKEVEQYSEEVGFSGVRFPQKFQGIKSVFDLILEDKSKFYSSSYVFKNCFVENSTLSGDIKFGHSPEGDFYKLELNNTQNGLKINFQEFDDKKRLQISARNFTFADEFNLFSPLLILDQSNINGTLDGVWSKDIYDGDWLINIKGKGLTSFSGTWIEFLDKVWSKFDQDIRSQVDHHWMMKLRNNKIFVDSIAMGSGQLLNLHGFLNISKPIESYLIFSMPKNTKKRPLKKPMIDLIFEDKNEI